MPSRADESFQVGTNLFQYLLQGSTQNSIILAISRLISSHIELSMNTLWIGLSRWLIIWWFNNLKYCWWVLLGAWTVIRANFMYYPSCICLCYICRCCLSIRRKSRQLPQGLTFHLISFIILYVHMHFILTPIIRVIFDSIWPPHFIPFESLYFISWPMGKCDVV